MACNSKTTCCKSKRNDIFDSEIFVVDVWALGLLVFQVILESFGALVFGGYCGPCWMPLIF